MDTELLVDIQIEDGQRLIEQLVRDGLEVSVAVWIKTSEESLWHLYIASPAAEASKWGEAYGKLWASLSKIQDSSVMLPDLALINDRDPIAQGAIKARDRYPARNPTKYPWKQLGRLSVWDSYIYPPKDWLRQSFDVTYVRQGEANHWQATTEPGELHRGLRAKGAVSYSSGVWGGEKPAEQRLATVLVLAEIDPKFDDPEFLDRPEVRRAMAGQARKMADELFRGKHPDAVIEHDGPSGQDALPSPSSVVESP